MVKINKFHFKKHKKMKKFTINKFFKPQTKIQNYSLKQKLN